MPGYSKSKSRPKFKIDLKDPSNSANRAILKRSIDEDLKRFKGSN